MGSQTAMLPQNEKESRNITYAHPVATFFHCAFKVAAIVTYLLCGIFSATYAINFVITIALLATDFWTVKNVTGRLLVGLRWWNDVDEQGASTWKFESLDQQACCILLVFKVEYQHIVAPILQREQRKVTAESCITGRSTVEETQGLFRLCSLMLFDGTFLFEMIAGVGSHQQE